ncbi:MAG: caspase family protein [Pseudomonadota bacterium]
MTSPLQKLCPAILVGCLAATGASAQTSLEIEAMLQRSGLMQELKAANFQPPDLTVNAVKRYAIVIGNKDYEHATPLNNAINDAALVAEFLRDQGYLTHEHYNVTKIQFEEILRSALFEVDKDTEVVFYFAGHGLQIGDKNYIVPVNAALDSAYSAPFETVSLQSLVSIIGARARSQVIILDSCRDNPFGPTNVYTDISNTPTQPRTGFSTQTAPVNTLLAFSTSPGGVALDGNGKNSPYTENFVAVASSNPGMTIGGVLEETRKELYKQTYGVQVSWESSTLIKPLYFDPKTVFDVASRSPIPFSDNTSTRSLALVASSLPGAVASVVTDEESDEAPLSLTARLEEEVSIGPALTPKIAEEETPSLKVVTPPRLGRLTLSKDGGLQQPVGYSEMSKEDLENVIYIANTAQQRAVEMESTALEDTFQLATASGTRNISVSLEPHPCDVQAGDYLDPDGVGLARYPNEIAPEEAMLACGAAVAEHPENGRFHYQLGRALMAMRNFDAAEASFTKARDLGHARAWYALGDLAANEAATTGGRPNTQAPERAMALFAMGVKAGDPYAFYALGRELMRYETDIRRQREGFDLMMRALEVGHTFAMNELGYFYLNKENAFYDATRGLRYLEESAARKDIYGYNNLGLVYMRGLGDTPVDPAKAEEWFKKASVGGHPNAPTNLGRMHAKGSITGAPNYPEAVKWYDQGLERGDAWAGANAAYIIATEGVKGLDLADAALRGGKAAALRNKQAEDYARQVLAALPVKSVDQATQRILIALGQELEADGAFGAGSERALEAVSPRRPPTDPVDRLIFTAGLFWEQSKFRVDLY